MEKLNQHTNQQALTNSIEEGLRIQAQNRLQRMLKQQQKKVAEAERSQPPSAAVDAPKNTPATSVHIKQEEIEQQRERPATPGTRFCFLLFSNFCYVSFHFDFSFLAIAAILK